MNPNPDQDVKFLQIWVFPREKNVTPRYQQITLANDIAQQDFQQILSPNPDDEGVWIHQDAWFSLAKFSDGLKKTYQLKQADNGVYAFVIEGRAKIAGQELATRDGLGIWETDNFTVESIGNSEILLMEVPMNF
ncbi:hypothetical protein ACFPVS_02030 [Neisseria weixii]|uniref:pirin family protein n=1 Tax=Neisseria weixii TaxID=1853276 RepID=UPI001E4C2CDD|nr:hypothetical protein [Neisseria weixii]